MADTDEVPGRDAPCLDETARFRPEGAFHDARNRGSETGTVELTLQQMAGAVEHWGAGNGEHEVPADVVNDLLDDGLDDGWRDDDTYDWIR
jgi:hypothetical protein